MAKKKKMKKPEEASPEEASPSVYVAKDIDDIFALRKPVAEKSKAQKVTPIKVPTPPSSRSIESNFEAVMNQVQAAKVKRPPETSYAAKRDDFADIRGTKKRSLKLPIVSYLQASERWMV